MRVRNELRNDSGPLLFVKNRRTSSADEKSHQILDPWSVILDLSDAGWILTNTGEKQSSII